MEQHSRLAVAHRVEGAATGQRHDRSACRVRLERREAEVLLTWQDECTAALEPRRGFAVGEPAGELHRRTGERLKRLALRPVADDDERQPERGAGTHREVDPLVRVEPRYDEEI